MGAWFPRGVECGGAHTAVPRSRVIILRDGARPGSVTRGQARPSPRLDISRGTAWPVTL